MISFLETVVACRNGALQVELDEALDAAVKACTQTGLKGEVCIKLKIEPSTTKDGGHMVEVTPSVTSKNPKFSTGTSHFFVVTNESDEPVALEREDPRQALMFGKLEKEIREASSNG